MTPDTEIQIVEALKKSRKYAYTCEQTLYRVAAWAVGRYRAPKEALKAAKRKLHQIYGAYVRPATIARVAEIADEIPEGASAEMLKTHCRRILDCHASTRERLPIVEGVYRDILAVTGAPAVVLDLACGVNSFALPWMNLPPQTQYHAFDIDHLLVDAVGSFLARMGRTGGAYCQDILVSPPEQEADLVLLLKTLPCLEQQEKGASLRLLRGLRAKHVVVSFPAKSLGGREKGMTGHYSAFMDRLLAELGAPAERLDYESETVYVIQTQGPPGGAVG